MNRWRVGEDIRSKETDGSPLTEPRNKASVKVDEANNRLHLLFI
jgi:hypothetical protein